MFSALVLAAAVAFTPSLAVQYARAMIQGAVPQGGGARFRHVELRSLADGMVFCGELNSRDADGVLSGWKEVMILVSANPGLRGVVVGRGRSQREMIRSVCRSGDRVNGRDYSAVLSVW
jgi:hypothetical protein